MKKKRIENPERILVVKAAGIGDLILAVPSLRALRSRFPGARIDLLTAPKCSDLLRRCPYLDEIHVLPTQGMQNRVVPSEIGHLFSSLRRLRGRRYDLMINLYHLFSRRGALRMRFLIQSVDPSVTLGRNTDGRGGFYDFSIPDSWVDPVFADRHEVEINLDVVRFLGAEDPGEGLEFWTTEEDFIRMRTILTREGVREGGTPWIVLNPGGDALYKRWPEEHFAQLADSLIREEGAEVLVTGGEGDRPVVEKILSGMRERPVNLAGKLDLNELAALLATADLMVTNDTGPMHLAAAVGTRVLALFGPGKPGRYAPYGPKGFHSWIRHPVVCSPCTDFSCRDRDCMRSISPREVLERIEQLFPFRFEKCR